MEWIVATVFVLVSGCSLISFLIARATCRNYMSQQVTTEKKTLLSQFEKQQVFNDAQVVVNEAQQELNDAQQEYMEALRVKNEALEAKLDEPVHGIRDSTSNHGGSSYLHKRDL